MFLPRFLLVFAGLAAASLGLAQTGLAQPGRALDDFSNYTLGESLSGKGEKSAWRSRGLNLALSGEIVAVEGTHVLGLKARHYVVFDQPEAFSIPADAVGTLSFRVRLPAPSPELKNDQAFFLIVKTREQANADLTNPNNGLLLLQFAYAAADRAYRLRLEGPGPSPTNALISPEKWHEVAVRIDMTLATYQVLLSNPPGAAPSLVVNHLYKDGFVPFKNRGTGPAELIYLRNHNLPAQVELDALRFTPGA